MKRLTERLPNGVIRVNFIEAKENAVSRLAAYEDTGLEPEEIAKIREVDAVPVVRCPKCEHYEDNGYHFCNKWEHFLPDDSEFFCAFGKRKEANT